MKVTVFWIRRKMMMTMMRWGVARRRSGSACRMIEPRLCFMYISGLSMDTPGVMCRAFVA